MAYMKVVCLVLMLLFIALLSNDHADAKGFSVSNSKGQVDCASGGTVAANMKTWKRKIGINNVNLQEIEGSIALSGSCDISSANVVVGKLGDEVNEVKHFGRKLSSVDDFPAGVSEGGLENFSADYSAPRHHPPKNN